MGRKVTLMNMMCFFAFESGRKTIFKSFNKTKWKIASCKIYILSTYAEFIYCFRTRLIQKHVRASCDLC